MRRPRLRGTAAAAVAISSLTAVSALGLAPTTPLPPAGAASLGACPLKALSRAKGPVDITFWESMTRANATTLQEITNAFNSSQSKVHVTLVAQAGYDDTWQKYTAGLSNGQLPDIVLLEDQRTQVAVDTKSFLPVQSCINASGYSTSDFLSRALAYWKINRTQEAMPFAVSNPIFYYNKLAFQKAGLNPNDPPSTLAEMITDAQKLKAFGSGMGLKLDPWHLETWLATANQLFVNNKNGRAARTTKATFDTATGLQIFTDLDQLVKSGDATTNPASGASEFDNLLGIGSGKYGMTIDSSADLGTISQVLSSGQYPNVQLGIGAFPVLNSSIPGGIEPGGSGVFIPNRVPAVDQAAAWQYMQWIDNTQSQATWAAGTGYIPIRKSSTETATVQHLWTVSPGYKTAFNQLNNGANDAATSGSVIGPYSDVRADILNAEQSMFVGNLTPKAALAQAESAVDATVASYNQRLGAS